NAVFIRSAIDCDRLDKIAVSRRRRGIPLKRSRIPRIIVRHFTSVLNAPEKVNNENDLGSAKEESGHRHEVVPLNDRRDDLLVSRTAIIPTAMNAGHSLKEHRKENSVNENYGKPVMQLSKEVIHETPGG